MRNKANNNIINKTIDSYLKNKPLFYSLIRPQESSLFYKHKSFVKPPVLDFGCDDGFFTSIVFGKKTIDVGLDLKTSQINKAEEEEVYKKTVVYNGLKIPFPNNYFKTVISNSVLEHLPFLQKNLKEIARVLKRKGFFLTTVMTDQWNKNLFGTKILGQNYQRFMKKKQKHYNLLSIKKWEEAFSKAGFKTIKKIGYLSKKNSQALDIFHYLSLPSLISYAIFNKWVLFPKIHSFFKTEKLIERIISLNTSLSTSSAVFFVLEKKMK